MLSQNIFPIESNTISDLALAQIQSSLIELKERYSKIQLPEIKIIDIRNKRRIAPQIKNNPLNTKEDKLAQYNYEKNLSFNAALKDEKSNILLKENLKIDKQANAQNSQFNFKEIYQNLRNTWGQKNFKMFRPAHFVLQQRF